LRNWRADHSAIHRKLRQGSITASASNAVAPAWSTPNVELHRDRCEALKRIAQPDDIGDVVAFLASHRARWVNGDTVHVDGGSKL